MEVFAQIQSRHFTFDETKEYKKELVAKIERMISLLGTSIPSNQSHWEGTYKIIVDKYIVYYSYSEDYSTCYIEYFKYSRQER